MSAFLIDASLPRATGNVIRAHGHQATDVRDIGLGTASDEDIADHARQHKLALISADQDFGNVLVFPPADYDGLVIIRPPAPSHDGRNAGRPGLLISSISPGVY